MSLPAESLNQLNPHFVYNSLNHLQYYIHAGDKRAALSYLSKFSRFMRQWLHHAVEKAVSMADEAALAEQYLTLECLRFERCFEYEVTVDAHSPVQPAPVAALVAIKAAEDVLYRQVLQKGAGAYIGLTFTLADGRPVCHIHTGGKSLSAVCQTVSLSLPNQHAGLCNA